MFGTAMERKFLLSFALAGLAGWFGVPDARAAEKTVKQVEASVGKEFTVSLEANHTTGFGWQLAKPLNEAVVKKVGSIYQEDDHPARMVGVGGMELWTFKGLKAGKTAIEFKYVRPGEADKPPAKSAKFQVTVKGAGPK